MFNQQPSIVTLFGTSLLFLMAIVPKVYSLQSYVIQLWLVLLRLSSLRFLLRYFRIIVLYIYLDNSCACGTIYLRGILQREHVQFTKYRLLTAPVYFFCMGRRRQFKKNVFTGDGCCWHEQHGLCHRTKNLISHLMFCPPTHGTRCVAYRRL